MNAETVRIASAAGRDAGNRAMRKGGREAWNADDWNAAAAVAARVLGNRAPARTERVRIASWGRWTCQAVRIMRVGRSYWVRVRGVGDFCMVDLAGAAVFAERMAERYG